MDELFSCRNCIQNCGQSLSVGRGAGYCIRHNSVIRQPDTTTCKYLHRKDLPRFVVDEGTREHAAEFAAFSGMVGLHTLKPVALSYYSEQYAWQTKTFDTLTNALAQYHKTEPAWVFVESFTSGADGRRAIAHGCLVRRYMDTCDTWKSTYRLILAFVQEIDSAPSFPERDLRQRPELLTVGPSDSQTAAAEALWDLVFVRFSLIQEYGFHAGLDDLIWVTDRVNGALVDFDWPALQAQLGELKVAVTEEIIDHAKREGEFFSHSDGRRDR